MISFQTANDEGADQTARMRRLVCAFVVRKPPKQALSRRGPYESSKWSGEQVWIRRLSEHSLVAYAVSTKISCTGPIK